MRSRSHRAHSGSVLFGLPPEFSQLVAELDADVVASRGWWWRAITAAAVGVPDREASRLLDRVPRSNAQATAVAAALRLVQQLGSPLPGSDDLGVALDVYGDTPADHARFLAEQVCRVVERHAADGRLPAGVAADAICDLVGNVDVWCDALEDVFAVGRVDLCSTLFAGLIAEFSLELAAAKIDEFTAAVVDLDAGLPGSAADPLVAAFAVGVEPSELAVRDGWPAVYRAVADTAVLAAEGLCGRGEARSDAWLTVACECWLFASLF